MDAKQALADLREISSQIRSAVLMSDDGTIAASTLGDEGAERMAKAARELLATAERTRPGLGPGALTQLEVATLEGSVFVVRDHGRFIVATTSPEPTVGLVFYDLKSCLRNAAEGTAPRKAKPKRVSETVSDTVSEKKSPKRSAPSRSTPKKDDAAS